MTIKTPQANFPVEQVHQVILNMPVTKDLSIKVFDYIEPRDVAIAYIVWEIRASYNITIQATHGQAVFGGEMIFNLASVIDWRVITDSKQQQVEIHNI